MSTMVGDRLMCELVIQAAERQGGDHMTYRRGDVIAVGPDDMDWGRDGSCHPEWRTLRLPNVTELEAQALLSGELQTDPQNPNQFLQRRGFRLDLDSMPSDMQPWLTDSTRAQPVLEVQWTWPELNLYRYRVEPLTDPNILGI